MANCKDCIHHKSCFNMAFCCGYKAEVLEGAETCDDFKNKADLVEVVRCKDCKYCTKAVSIENTYFCVVGTNAFDTELDNFCSYGERKGGVKE